MACNVLFMARCPFSPRCPVFKSRKNRSMMLLVRCGWEEKTRQERLTEKTGRAFDGGHRLTSAFGHTTPSPRRARRPGRMTLFEKEPDFRAFERCLREAQEAVPVPLLCYCVMPNHWLSTPRRPSVSRARCARVWSGADPSAATRGRRARPGAWGWSTPSAHAADRGRKSRAGPSDHVARYP